NHDRQRTGHFARALVEKWPSTASRPQAESPLKPADWRKRRNVSSRRTSQPFWPAAGDHKSPRAGRALVAEIAPLLTIKTWSKRLPSSPAPIKESATK